MSDPASEAELRRTAERRADAKLGFLRHALIYAAVNAGLAVLNLVTSPGYLWFVWPLFGWGVGLAAHGLSVHASMGNLRERAIVKEMARLRSRAESPGP